VRTYRELFAVPEFRPLFVASSLNTAAGTMEMLAVATFVYAGTGSPLLAALAQFGGSITQVLGGLTLLSVADRVPPRAALVFSALSTAVFAGVVATFEPGPAVVLGLVLLLGLVSSVTSAARWGLVVDVLPEDGYVLGRSVLNMTVGAMQVAGFAAGGLLLALIEPRAALLVAMCLSLGGALVLRLGLTARAPRATGRAGVRATFHGNRRLWRTPGMPPVFLALWVPNGLVVGAEALFVPYAGDQAAALFIAGALGMLAGDTVVGRFLPPATRDRFLLPLRALLALPYLLFVVSPGTGLATILVAVASAGFGAGLLLQERLVAATPGDLRAQSLGLASSGMMGMQAVGALVAGTLAELLEVHQAMTAMAVLSLLVTLALTPALRPSARPRVAEAVAGQ
jgi:predicted MFS family arabinose efflux permease